MLQCPVLLLGRQKPFWLLIMTCFPPPAQTCRMLSMAHHSKIPQLYVWMQTNFYPFIWLGTWWAVSFWQYTSFTSRKMFLKSFADYPFPSFSVLSFSGTLLFGSWNCWVGPLLRLFDVFWIFGFWVFCFCFVSSGFCCLFTVLFKRLLSSILEPFYWVLICNTIFLIFKSSSESSFLF